MFFKLAWRNIWRNKRRTFITVGVIFFAVVLAEFMRSQQLGSYENMIKNTVGSFTGHIQIHQKGFWKEQNLDNSFEEDEKLIKGLQKKRDIQHIIPRLESCALFAGGERSKAGMVVGIDPDAEKSLSNPLKYLKKGKYFENNEEVLMGQGLADYLKLDVGDTLIVIGQGYQGMNAAGKYVIKGIIKFPSPDMNKGMIYLPLPAAQELFAAYGRLTSLSLLVKNPRKVVNISKDLEKSIDSKTYEVMHWREMLPELVQMIQSDDIGGQVMIGILYMVVGFGIFGTIIMMTAERYYEFGVLISIGLRRWKLALIVLLETLVLALIGVVAGSLAISPLLWYLHLHPIPMTGVLEKTMEDMGFEALMVFSVSPIIFISQALVVMVMTVLISIYPLWLVSRIKVVEAMRS